MALAQPHDRPVSEELVREHARGWESFTHFMRVAVIGVAVLLILMAIFLL
ncbi:aa3-type cytochrome c oxidase subunit IV [Azospirillum sp. TSO22-1]|nr:aa3-type cytochrome c oxidase subunit IV [Azospirillum sp. TSO22-1]